MTIETQIRGFIAENFLFTDDASGLDAEASLLEQGLIDSTGVLELVAFLEDRLGLSVADAEIVPENLDSVAALVAFVARKQQAAAAA
ncbi:acyl carrier protein [Salinarimonas sp.]|uniref:acyl carrier protein n=1 Tax=Salinarimonas sp. TaxID=2766526 RepID=UPI0032D8DC13